MKRILLLFLCFVSAAAASAAPYVVRGAAGGWEEWSLLGAAVVRSPVREGDLMTIPSAAGRPAFAVRLRPPAELAPDELAWPKDAPVFVMADSHGQFEIATELLRKHGVIDETLKWKFGRGWLVVLGDAFDRGPHHTEILWLLYELEAEAAAAGGKVCFVLGNHETMDLLGDLRYLNPKYVEEAKAFGVASYSQLWSKETLLGQWLRTKPAVLKIGRTLFLHGGISAAAVDDKWTIAAINRVVRARLNGDLGKEDPQVQFVFGPMGPLWYRGYFPDMPKLVQATPEQVAAVGEFLGVDRIAVGHTIVEHVTSLYSGRVCAVDVNMERDKAGNPVAEGVLVQSDGSWQRAKIDGTREILIEAGR